MTTDWIGSAACAKFDPEVWFPDSEGDNGAEAMRICRRQCPVAAQCLRAALAEERDDGWCFGVRGGLPAKARMRLIRARRQAA